MPITTDEFKKGRKIDSLESQIEVFLKEHPQQAFTMRELAEAMGFDLGIDLVRDFVVLAGLQSALNALVGEGSITSRLVSSETYYKRS